MSIDLTAIAFNHNVASSTTSALNIRIDALQPVPVPEWHVAAATTFPAAYALQEATGNVLEILAEFRRNDPALRFAQVRARRVAGSVLGDIEPTVINFDDGGERTARVLPFDSPGLGTTAVGIHDVSWKWQYRRRPHAPWTSLRTTQHRIYAVLRTPRDPWRQQPWTPINTQLPWADVLAHACRMASGARTAEDAAARITRAVNGLGPQFIEYGCEIQGWPAYASLQYFDCSAFLDVLAGGLGNGRYVNCTDCATIVSTFANAVGCDLWQSTMGVGGFQVNPVRLIGKQQWRPACGWPGFNLHEVAWAGACDVEDLVFDASLVLDSDADPRVSPHAALVATNMRFGNTGDGAYRDRLATLETQSQCRPWPASRQRRIVA